MILTKMENEQKEKKQEKILWVILILLLIFAVFAFYASSQSEEQPEKICYECITWSCSSIEHGCENFNCVEQIEKPCNEIDFNDVNLIYQDVPFPNAKFSNATNK